MALSKQGTFLVAAGTREERAHVIAAVKEGPWLRATRLWRPIEPTHASYAYPEGAAQRQLVKTPLAPIC